MLKILFAWVLPRHSCTATCLSALLKKLERAGSIQAAWESLRLPLGLGTVYHILQRLRGRLDSVRAALHAQCRPPRSMHNDPLRQTAEHLGCAFGDQDEAVSAFQLTLQCPFMG